MCIVDRSIKSLKLKSRNITRYLQISLWKKSFCDFVLHNEIYVTSQTVFTINLRIEILHRYTKNEHLTSSIFLMYTNQLVHSTKRVRSSILLFFSEFWFDAYDGFPSFVAALVLVGELPGTCQLSSGTEQHRVLIVPGAI